MASVSAIAPQHRTIEAPDDLRRLQGWLIWRYETRHGETKPRKVPYWVDGGRRYGQQGGANDRARLTTFESARDAAARRGFDGVGLALLPEWGVTALDFDNCIGDGGALPAEIEQVIGRTYAEYSPSGRGVRAFVKGSLGNHKSLSPGAPYGLETFSSSGFVTFTGHMLPATEVLGLANRIAPADDAIADLCRRRFVAPTASISDDFTAGYEPRLDLAVDDMQKLLDRLDPDMTRDDWIRVGMALHHETEGDDTGFDLWNDWSSLGAKYPSEEALRGQWDSFTRRKGPGRKQVTMRSVIKMADEAPTVVDTENLRAEVEAAVEALPPAEGVSTPLGYEGRFPVVSAAGIARQKPPAWIIKGVVPQADLIVLYGASGAGKSFVAMDMAACVARGVPWRGRRVRQGKAVIVAAEGGSGVGKRIRAYCHYHGIDVGALGLGVITAAPNLLEKGDLGDLAKAIYTVGGVSLIVIDTFAQVTPGANENTGEDMGRALAHARVLREVTGATVMLVHHAGKDLSRGSRGWSGIRAAADAEIEVSRDDERGSREIRLSKMKDGDDGAHWGFRLETVVVGMDEDGDDVTSCVAVEAETPVPAPQENRKNIKRRGHIERHILEVVATLDPALTSIRYEDLVNKAVAMLPEPEDGKRDARRQNTTRALNSLLREKEGPLLREGGLVIFCE